VRRVPARRVSGAVVGPSFGAPDGRGEMLVLLSAEDVAFDLGGVFGGHATASTVTQEGPFVFMSVPPGTYTIDARPGVHGDLIDTTRIDAHMPRAITVGNGDVTGITVKVAASPPSGPSSD